MLVKKKRKPTSHEQHRKIVHLFASYEHKEIMYYDKDLPQQKLEELLKSEGVVDKLPRDENSLNQMVICNAHFLKEKCFLRKQKNKPEYRFVFRLSNKAKIKRMILCANDINADGNYSPPSYIKSIFINPSPKMKMKKENFEKIQEMAKETDLLKCIKNLQKFQAKFS